MSAKAQSAAPGRGRTGDSLRTGKITGNFSVFRFSHFAIRTIRDSPFLLCEIEDIRKQRKAFNIKYNYTTRVRLFGGNAKIMSTQRQPCRLLK
jgi:hypothetical protein